MNPLSPFYLVAGLFALGAVAALLLKRRVPRIVTISLFVGAELIATLGVMYSLRGGSLAPLDVGVTIAVVITVIAAGLAVGSQQHYDSPVSGAA